MSKLEIVSLPIPVNRTLLVIRVDYECFAIHFHNAFGLEIFNFFFYHKTMNHASENAYCAQSPPTDANVSVCDHLIEITGRSPTWTKHNPQLDK